MKFHKFAEFLNQIESTSGRNEITVLLAEFLGKVPADEVAQVMYLMQGRLVPNFIDLEFGFSQKSGLRALSELIDNEEKVKQMFGDKGDLGLVAEEIVGDGIAKKKLETKDLGVSKVYESLMGIAQSAGKGSQEAKLTQFKELIGQLDPISARYAVRVVMGNLRIGFSDKTVLDALSWSKAGDKSLRKQLDVAYGARADIGELARLVLTTDLAKLPELLTNIKFVPGVPVASKLVERESSAAGVFKRTGRCMVQPKLDGLRCQIHLLEQPNAAGHKVEIFSRNMESLTAVFPDIVEAVQQLPVTSIIIDSEAIGFDTENETYLPFQQTIQRRRKYNIDEAVESIPIRAMAFDVMYLNGEDLSREDLETRVEKLEKVLKKSDQKVIQQLETKFMDTEEELDAYFKEKIGIGLEGIIVKKLATPYDPGTRNFDWIKLKANTQSDMVDTVDAVVLGYFRGRGVRAEFGVGALLVGVYNPDDDKFYSVAKVGTGMTEANLSEIKKDLDPFIIKEKPDNVVVEKPLHPDVWVTPEIVMEIDADEATRSPNHTAARGLKASFEPEAPAGKGLSLRFPRMKVWKRDKKATQATTVQELLRIFELRFGK